MPSKQSVEWYRAKAYEMYNEEGEVEVDDKASVSKNTDGDDGAYVQAWVWVPDPEEE